MNSSDEARGKTNDNRKLLIDGCVLGMLLKSLISAIPFWLVENDNRWVKTLTKYVIIMREVWVVSRYKLCVSLSHSTVACRLVTALVSFSLFSKNKLILSGVTKTNNFLINIKFFLEYQTLAKKCIKFLAYWCFFFRNVSTCIYKDISVQTTRSSSPPHPSFLWWPKNPALEQLTSFQLKWLERLILYHINEDNNMQAKLSALQYKFFVRAFPRERLCMNLCAV